MAEPHEPGSYLKATLESQPAELTRLLADDSGARAATRLRGCSRIFLAGTGTSFHGALAGQFILRSIGLQAWAANLVHPSAPHHQPRAVALNSTRTFRYGSSPTFTAASTLPCFRKMA